MALASLPIPSLLVPAAASAQLVSLNPPGPPPTLLDVLAQGGGSDSLSPVAVPYTASHSAFSQGVALATATYDLADDGFIIDFSGAAPDPDVPDGGSVQAHVSFTVNADVAYELSGFVEAMDPAGDHEILLWLQLGEDPGGFLFRQIVASDHTPNESFDVGVSGGDLVGGAFNLPVLEGSVTGVLEAGKKYQLFGVLGVNEEDDPFTSTTSATAIGSLHLSLTPGGVPDACMDGLDNDLDGLVDLADPGCADLDDLSERDLTKPCDDGADNDGDGGIDFDPLTAADSQQGTGDPGCLDPDWIREDPQCQDGINNDFGQDPNPGSIDFDGGQSIHGVCGGTPGSCPAGVSDPEDDGVANPDPQCVGKPWKLLERRGCGLGWEIALLAPLLLRLRRTRRVTAATRRRT